MLIHNHLIPVEPMDAMMMCIDSAPMYAMMMPDARVH